MDSHYIHSCCTILMTSLLSLADDLGYGDISSFSPLGNISTPHIDEMTKRGMMFTDAHTTSSVCTPSRYSIVTGRYNWRSRWATRPTGCVFGHLFYMASLYRHLLYYILYIMWPRDTVTIYIYINIYGHWYCDLFVWYRLKHGVLLGYDTPLIPPERATIASLLKPAGYTTAIVGKWYAFCFALLHWYDMTYIGITTAPSILYIGT
jgi:hypothetical protein